MGRLNSHRADPRVWRREITNSLGAGPEKMDEHKQDENKYIEKKVDIFHILKSILAKTGCHSRDLGHRFSFNFFIYLLTILLFSVVSFRCFEF